LAGRFWLRWTGGAGGHHTILIRGDLPEGTVSFFSYLAARVLAPSVRSVAGSLVGVVIFLLILLLPAEVWRHYVDPAASQRTLRLITYSWLVIVAIGLVALELRHWARQRAARRQLARLSDVWFR
jgi:hypothetical protein